MNRKEAEELGFKEANAHPVLIFGLYGFAAGIAWYLPLGWFWSVVAFIAMVFGIGFGRIFIGAASGRIRLDDDAT